MYIKRYLETTIEKLSGCCKVLQVTGPRQVGKTTLLRRLAEGNRTYVTMDDINVRSLAMTEPGLFLQRYKPPLLIDEIQMAPKLLPYIKMYVDEHGNNGDFWLTGSHAFDLMENVTESLAGRIAIVHLLGFRFNMARKRIRKRQQCQVNTCAAVAGFHDMPEIGNQTVRENDS